MFNWEDFDITLKVTLTSLSGLKVQADRAFLKIDDGGLGAMFSERAADLSADSRN